MKKSGHLNWADLFFLLGTAIFFFSCIYSTLQVARTLEPKQGELSAGYLQGRPFTDFSGDPVQLIGINGRLGVANNLDVGIEHTFDATADNGGDFNSVWSDVKWQLSNRENLPEKLTFSSGLLKGYAYDSDADIHFTSLPLYFSLPLSDRFTPTFMYRYELLSDGFFPNWESFDDPRHSLILGIEYGLKPYDPAKWTTKLGISAGYMNSLTGDPDGEDLLILNFGLKFTSPMK